MYGIIIDHSRMRDYICFASVQKYLETSKNVSSNLALELLGIRVHSTHSEKNVFFFAICVGISFNEISGTYTFSCINFSSN